MSSVKPAVGSGGSCRRELKGNFLPTLDHPAAVGCTRVRMTQWVPVGTDTGIELTQGYLLCFCNFFKKKNQKKKHTHIKHF